MITSKFKARPYHHRKVYVQPVQLPHSEICYLVQYPSGSVTVHAEESMPDYIAWLDGHWWRKGYKIICLPLHVYTAADSING